MRITLDSRQLRADRLALQGTLSEIPASMNSEKIGMGIYIFWKLILRAENQ